MNYEEQAKELKKTITESMEGVIVDHEARGDKDIVEFYADVFVTICEDFAKQTQPKIKVDEKGNRLSEPEDHGSGIKTFSEIEYQNAPTLPEWIESMNKKVEELEGYKSRCNEDKLFARECANQYLHELNSVLEIKTIDAKILTKPHQHTGALEFGQGEDYDKSVKYEQALTIGEALEHRIILIGLKETRVIELQQANEQIKALKEGKECLGSKINECRDYLMQVEPDEITVEECLISLGYNSNGF